MQQHGCDSRVVVPGSAEPQTLMPLGVCWRGKPGVPPCRMLTHTKPPLPACSCKESSQHSGSSKLLACLQGKVLLLGRGGQLPQLLLHAGLQLLHTGLCLPRLPLLACRHT